MTNRRSSAPETKLDWGQLIDQALTMPGNTAGVYDRFHSYSTMNKALLMAQGVFEPVATYKGWQAVGRQVSKGSRAKEIIRPISVKVNRDDPEDEERRTKFKAVRCIFGLSETEGDELPPAPTPGFDFEKAMRELEITEVPFDVLDGNTQGISHGHNLAINPLAKYPNKTRVHEMAHIVLGHTVEPLNSDYLNHRGLYEFEAESTAYLTLNELDLMTEDQATVSRGYVQGWLEGERPPDASIRRVFKATDTILTAGRVTVDSLIPLEQTEGVEA